MRAVAFDASLVLLAVLVAALDPRAGFVVALAGAVIIARRPE